MMVRSHGESTAEALRDTEVALDNSMRADPHNVSLEKGARRDASNCVAVIKN